MDLALYLAQQLVNAVTLGSVYALSAIGLSLVYGVLRLINFAHGDLLALGAYAALALLAAPRLPLGAALLLPVALVGAVGLAVERVAYRPIRRAPEVNALIVSLALSVIVQNLLVMTLTAQPRPFHLPPQLAGLLLLGGVVVSRMALFTTALAVGLMTALHLMIRRTRVGTAIRATAEDRDAAELMGIPTDRVIGFTFALGAALGGFAGVMLGGQYGRIDPFMGFLPGLKAFVAAVLGGLGSVPGAILGGYLLGFGEILFVGLLPPALSGYRDAFVFTLLILILLLRPQGVLAGR
ncbi:MAG: branched-chain amino acid ABC transporter permease [Armatimonadota bacterium]|nr:branched-chain amino acid ABC transporter permease [Armatimonadota bacterium]MDR7449133.1 branched-chain amino acid ABC transporter permease [Armatimonadota bacterium]MDR7460032.1 branched-chain amino acid ABC transporter permease [Armatimonadota bacterium]MDR7480847.1 branched-chain amino acid ABC transporter permease [Armatimonadota bacterium]MDR7489302.1 branched-chain amino acid ABC transporter permease [Armatimonadota bacterium]